MSCVSSAAVDRLKLTHLVDTSIQANAVGVGQLKVSGYQWTLPVIKGQLIP